MLKDLFSHPGALLFALFIHAALILLLVFSVEWVDKPPQLQGSEKIVQAVVVDSGKLRAEKQRKLDEEAARLKAIATEELRQREAAQQQLAEQQAEEQRQSEAAERAQRQAAEQRRQEQVKTEQAAQQKNRQEHEKNLAETEAKRKMETEQKRKAATDAQRKAEEQAKRQAEDEAKRKAVAESKRQAEEDAKRKADEARRQREEEEAMQRRLAEEQQGRLSQSAIDQQVAIIRQKVARNWIRPPSARAGMSCEVFVRLIPGGEVVEVRVVRSSGDAMFDRSVEAAVLKASPLPMPSDPSLFDQFRQLRFVFKPEG
ncbi:MAG: cell envelope integrity protein TolA [Pseudomonadota bacterium]